MLWIGLDWTGLDWTGLDWTGLDWTQSSQDSADGRHHQSYNILSQSLSGVYYQPVKCLSSSLERSKVTCIFNKLQK